MLHLALVVCTPTLRRSLPPCPLNIPPLLRHLGPFLLIILRCSHTPLAESSLMMLARTLILFATSAMASLTISKPSVVFTPGAWHRPTAFDLVRAGLDGKGWDTHAVSLPSVGSEPATVGLEQDAASLRAKLVELVEAGKEVVLVVHSYGGMVGSNAVEGLGQRQRAAVGKPGGIIMFVYLTAFVAPKGVSLVDMLQGQFLPWMRTEGDKVFPDTPEQIFYADVSPELTAKAVSELSWEPKRIFSDPATYEPWRDMECMYFFTEQDQAIPVAIQKQLAAALGPDAPTFTANASHSPFLSMPDKVVEGVELAAKVGRERAVAVVALGAEVGAKAGKVAKPLSA